MSNDQFKSDEVTPERVYLNRRKFLETSIYGGSALLTFAGYRFFRKSEPRSDRKNTAAADKSEKTSYEDITGYNNFYEFSTDKEAVASAAKDWKISDWALTIDGLVEQPQQLKLSDIARLPVEERVYRFRCVEGWSMIIPWLGIPLASLLEKSKPHARATHVAFETYYSEAVMPNARAAGIAFPYVEGLRLDEALHPLTIIATGLYGKNLPPQNGAPLRLVVPWKYGFKSIKSIVRIRVTDQQPPTTWNIANPEEYGFYSNVNPAVDHPRWSQGTERLIGSISRRPTLPFNGYEDQVAGLYRGMDLRVNF